MCVCGLGLVRGWCGLWATSGGLCGIKVEFEKWKMENGCLAVGPGQARPSSRPQTKQPAQGGLSGANMCTRPADDDEVLRADVGQPRKGMTAQGTSTPSERRQHHQQRQQQQIPAAGPRNLGTRKTEIDGAGGWRKTAANSSDRRRARSTAQQSPSSSSSPRPFVPSSRPIPSYPLCSPSTLSTKGRSS